MPENKTSAAQIKASRSWEAKNKERTAYLASRRSARSFIRNKATTDDLGELEKLIAERRQILNNPPS
ncbi:MAG: hypothetical protein ACE3JK_18885 [Sporolactobacillus sp.]